MQFNEVAMIIEMTAKRGEWDQPPVDGQPVSFLA